MARKLSRRSFLECALAGGAAAGTANLTIMRDAFAQAAGDEAAGAGRSQLLGDRLELGRPPDHVAGRPVNVEGHRARTAAVGRRP